MTLEERVRILALCEIDEVYRASILKAIDDPETGDALFINLFVVTYDPRNDPDTNRPIGYVPMLLWPAQERCANEFGRAIDEGHDIGGEKSRDMGMTWIALGVIFKRWLRRPGFSALVGTMTETLVDDIKSPASLFWKLDCMLQHLPSWLKPVGFNPRKHRSWMNMVNPEMASTITGRAPTVRFPVGDRKSCVYYDDWAQWEFGGDAWENAFATTNCRMATWTANGVNHAYELRFSKGRFEGVQTKVVNIHWKDDPRKQRTAKDEETGEVYNVWERETVGDPKRGLPGKISRDQFLKDYEFVYELSQKGRIYAEQLPHARIGDFPYDPKFPTYTFWDYGRTDDCVIAFAQWDYEQGRLRFVDCIVRSGHAIGYYVPFVKGRSDANEVLEHEASYTPDDWTLIKRRESWQVYDRLSGKRVVRYVDHFGDPSGKQKSISHNKSAHDVLIDNDIIVHMRDTNEEKSYKGRIEALRFLLPFCDFDRTHCEPLITALQNYKWNKAGTQPEHDVFSHPCAACEYGAVNLRAEIEAALRARTKATAIKRAGLETAVFGVDTHEVEAGNRRREELLYNGFRGAFNAPDSDDFAHSLRNDYGPAGY